MNEGRQFGLSEAQYKAQYTGLASAIERSNAEALGVARGPSEIDRELGQLQTTVNVLGESIMRLADQLQAVRIPSPENRARAETAEPLCSSKVGASIQTARQEAQHHNVKLLELLASLAI